MPLFKTADFEKLAAINGREFQAAYNCFCKKVAKADTETEYQAYLAAARHIVNMAVKRGDDW